MTEEWPTVKLGEVIRLSNSAVPTTQLDIINLAGVYSFGRGLFKRGPMSPGETTYKTYNKLVADDFVISQPKAWEGALARVTPEFEGWFLSPVFPTFRADRSRIEPKFLEWFCKRELVWAELAAKSRGIGARRESVLPKQFLSLDIPLPSLAKQRQLVALLEELATLIENAQNLRKETMEDVNRILAAEELRLWNLSPTTNVQVLESVTSYLSRGRQSKQGKSDHYLIKTQHVQLGKLIPSTLTLETDIEKKVKPDAIVRKNDILIACSAAGCLGRVARYTDERNTCSTDTHVAIARPNASIIDPEYLYLYLKGAQGQHQLRSRERGDWEREKIGFRLTELNVSDLRAVPVPLPSMGEQKRIVVEHNKLQLEIDTIKKIQFETSADLEALLPVTLEKAFQGELIREWKDSDYKAHIPSITEQNIVQEPVISPAPVNNIPRVPCETTLLSLCDIQASDSLRQKAAFSAYIAHRCQHKNLGRVKIAKLYYFAHRLADINLTEQFARKAAGPLDSQNKTILKYAEQRGWLLPTPEENNHSNEKQLKPVIPGSNIQEAIESTKTFLGPKRDKVDSILRDLKSEGWEILELWATVFDAALELKANRLDITAKAIRRIISQDPEWADKLKRPIFSEHSINNALSTLRRKQYLSA